jgi:transposase-like protein
MGMRKQFTNEFKAKVALEALKGLKTMNELASEYGVHSTQITAWRNQLKEQAAGVFGNPHDKVMREQKELIDRLYKNIGQIQVENDWMKKNLQV